MPSAVPRRLTSSILRMSAGVELDDQAGDLDPGVVDQDVEAAEAATVVRDRGLPAGVVGDVEVRRSRVAPRRAASATLAPSSSCRSAITTVAPAAASAAAIPSPSPWAPPVTRALRPVRSRSVMGAPCLRWDWWRPCTLRLWTVVKTLLDSLSRMSSGRRVQTGSGRMTDRDRVTHRDRAPAARAPPRRQVRRAPRPAGRVRPADPRRARATPGRACGRSPQNSEFSHGVVHYYFDDKLELIIYCVRYYKAHVRDPVRRGGRRVDDGRRAARPVRRQAGADARATRRRCTASGTTCARQSMFEDAVARRRLDDRPDPRGDDLAGRQPLRRAGRAARRRAGGRRPTRCSTACSSRPCWRTGTAGKSRCRGWPRRSVRSCRSCSPRRPDSPGVRRPGASSTARRTGLTRTRLPGIASPL